MINLLTFTSLYPNRIQPRHGIFVEERLRHLLATGEVRSRVVAPVPWFPFTSPAFGRYAEIASVPGLETRNDIEIIHPRYPLIPKFGMTLAPSFMVRGALPAIRRILQSGYEFDAIDAHYFYPDGVAAVSIARRLKKPVVVTARGTDINLIARYRLPRKRILSAATHCSAIITVCRALKDALVGMGVAANRVTVLRNGVDLVHFRPVNRERARDHLGYSGRVLLSVGHLIERKGHHIAIEALAQLPEASLVIVGEGEYESRLRNLAHVVGVTDRVRFEGAVSRDELPSYFSGADALVLASDREGMANVLLESLACGTPVIATPAWGTPEVISDPCAGILMSRREPSALAEAYRALFDNYPCRDETRRFAEQFSWDATTRGQLDIFSRL